MTYIACFLPVATVNSRIGKAAVLDLLRAKKHGDFANLQKVAVDGLNGWLNVYLLA